MIQFVIEQVAVNGVAVNFLEAHLKLILIEASNPRQLFQRWRILHVPEKVFFGMFDLAHSLLVVEERAAFCIRLACGKIKAQNLQCFGLEVKFGGRLTEMNAEQLVEHYE